MTKIRAEPSSCRLPIAIATALLTSWRSREKVENSTESQKNLHPKGKTSQNKNLLIIRKNGTLVPSLRIQLRLHQPKLKKNRFKRFGAIRAYF